jgi:WD40 repeat protein
MADLDVFSAELIAGRDWDGLAGKLCSLAYVQRKADSRQMFDLIAEFDAAAAAIPSSHPASRIFPVLATSLRRNATFISRHPAATFQCFWNSCWWHDCRDRGDFAEVFTGDPAICMAAPDEGGPVSQLMKSWRSQKATGGKGSAWVRSLLPPTTSIAGQLRLEIPIDSETGRPAALSLSKEHLVVWSRDENERMEPRVWSCQTGEPLPDIDWEEFPYPDPSLSPDKKVKVSFGGKDGGWGRPVRVSDARTGASVAAFPVDDDHNIRAAAFSADGTLVAAGGYGIDYEGYVYIWDLQSRSLRMFLALQWSVDSLAFSQSGAEILAGCSHGLVEIRKLANAAVRTSIQAHDDSVISAAFSSDEKLIASISYDGTLRVWDLAAETSERRFAPHPEGIVEVKFSPDGNRLVTRSSNGTTWLWDGNTGKPIRCLYKSSSIVQMGGDSEVCLFVGNYMVVSVAHGGGVWKSSDGYCIADVADRVYLGQSIAFTTDGKRFALWNGCSDETGVITIHDIRTGDLWDAGAETDVLGDELECPGGHFVATMTADGEIRTRRLPDRIELARIQAHAGGVTCCAFSADNALIVSGGGDDIVKVWEWETATEIFSATLNPAHPRQRARKARSSQPDPPQIRTVKFIDEHTIAAAIDEAQIVVWNFRSGEHVKTVNWTETLDEYPRQPRYRAERRGDEVCIVDTDADKEVAWFPCGRGLVSGLRLIAHPNGRAWAGMLGGRVFHFVLESHSAA